MASIAPKQEKAKDTDFGQCEYVPFGSDSPIKLSFQLILKWLAVKTAKGATPSEQDLMKFLMTCKAKRLNPFDGDAFLIGYDGKDGPVFSTIVAHQAFLKRAETHPEFDGMESGVIVKVGDEIRELVGDFFPAGSVLVGGWATVFFVNRGHHMTKRLKLSTFDRGRSLWKTNPEGMIVKCAEADAYDASFPQLIGGMYLREEIEATATRPAATAAPALTDGRGEQIPFPTPRAGRERAFADRAGCTVNAGKTPRYEQDAAAVEATERLRGKAAAVESGELPGEDVACTITDAGKQHLAGAYGDMENRCAR